MTLRRSLTSLRDWAALIGALGMVGFLTFVPQHAPVPGADTSASRQHAEIAWPSRTAALSPAETADR